MVDRQKPCLVISEMQVVTQATVTAAERLGLDPAALATIIGLPEASICRMQCLDHLLERGSEPLARSLQLIRLFRTLNGLSGGSCEVAKTWLASHHAALGVIPAQHIKSPDGLGDVLAYLEQSPERDAGGKPEILQPTN